MTMPLPKVDPAGSGEVQAIQKLHEEIFRVVPFDYIDFDYSMFTLLRIDYWSNIPGIFDGDHQHQACSLQPFPLNFFKFVFVKPIWLNWTYIQCIIQNQINVCEVTYADGTVEFLVHSTLFDGGYDVFAPPTKPIPIHAIQFWNMDPVNNADILELIMTMADVALTVSVAPGSLASTNQFQTNQNITPIPPGPLGANLVFGFDSTAIIVKNSSPGPLEISEDGGLTWEEIVANWAVAFDFKKRGGIIIRDPAGAGGQSYQVWAW